MSIGKLISIKVPIYDAMEALNIDHDKLIPKFTRWATLAEKEIGSYTQYELKRMVVDINQCVACLPNDCVLVEVALLGDHGENCDNLLRNSCNFFGALNIPSTYGTVNNTFMVVDVGDNGDGVSFGSVAFSIQNNKMIFPSNNNDGRKLTIQYLAYKLDCDGFMEVGENHVLAITNYIMWNYYKDGNDYLVLRKADSYRNEWDRECAHARAQDAEMTVSQRREVVRNYHDAYAGISLNQGMYTTLGNYYNIW